MITASYRVRIIVGPTAFWKIDFGFGKIGFVRAVRSKYINFCDQLDAPSFLFCNMYITLSPQRVSNTTALIIRRSQLYYAQSGMSLPTGCHATH
jgi:hypothetical protein